MSERARLVQYFDDAVTGGAARYKVAQLMALSERTIKRWRRGGDVAADRRPDTQPAPQPHQLTPEEEQAMLDTCNLSEFRSLPPSQIPMRQGSCRLMISEDNHAPLLTGT